MWLSVWTLLRVHSSSMWSCSVSVLKRGLDCADEWTDRKLSGWTTGVCDMNPNSAGEMTRTTVLVPFFCVTKVLDFSWRWISPPEHWELVERCEKQKRDARFIPPRLLVLWSEERLQPLALLPRGGVSSAVFFLILWSAPAARNRSKRNNKDDFEE